jgi:hypothetical protein
MGLSFRKSVRVGPFRFNFSTRGIGVSAGIPGFRIGTGPRGAYVHMGAGGVYYRQSLGGAAGRSGGARPHRSNSGLGPLAPPARDFSVGPMQEIESRSVLELTDSSSEALLAEIQQRQALLRIAPWVLGGSTVLLFSLWNAGVRGVPFVVAGIVTAGVYWWASARDALRRTVVLGYELDPVAACRFESLVSSIQALNSAGGLWHIPVEAEVHDRKYHAGASSIVKRDAIRPGLGQPPMIKTNVDVPYLRVGKQVVYFMPDRALVFDRSQVGAVSYGSLMIDVSAQRFIEDAGVPRDAEVVDCTWRYVNKKGGPDRRFKDNHEIPIALYEQIHFRSASGLNEVVQVSRRGLGHGIAQAIAMLAPLTDRVNPLLTSPESTARSEQTPRSQVDHRDERPTTVAAGRATNGPESLRRGKTANVIAERPQAWEHRAFALALTDVMNTPPSAPSPSMPTNLRTRDDVAAWASAQLEVPQLLFAAMEGILNGEIQVAFGPPGQPGDDGGILRAVWSLGYHAAGARAWAEAVRATPVPPRFRALRDEISRTIDQPLHQLAALGPDLLRKIERALASPIGSPERKLDMVLALKLENEDALQQAMKDAFGTP